MVRPIYVIGHLNPDTDSICSALAYAHLKTKLTGNPVVARRAGKINLETRFVLDYFQVPEPEFIADVKARVGDMLSGEAPIAVQPSTTLREVGILTNNENAKTLPIVDENNKLLGIITLGDLAHKYLQELGLENLGALRLTVENILRTLNGRLLVNHDTHQELSGNVIIGAMNPTSMARIIKPGDLVLLGDREEAQLRAINAGAACLIITAGYTISEVVRKAALQAKVTVMSVPYDTFATARLINMSAPVETMVQKQNIISFNVDDLVDDARKVMLDTRFRNYPVVDSQNRLLGVISRYHLLALARKQVILVDHNERSQAVPGLEQAEVLEVIDHHRLGDIQTGEPIYFRNEPVGCTATIVAGMYQEHQVEIPQEMAGILLAAILSDTVIFKSPTCTPRDQATAKLLAEIAGVDMLEFGQEMYRAGSSLVGRSYEEIIFEDFKEFKLGDLMVGIGQVETMDTGGLQEMVPGLLMEMEQIRKNRGYDLVLLMVTDILREGTELLIAGEAIEVVEKSFNSPVEQQKVYLPGVMSRKKQVIPPLSQYLANR